MLMTNGIGASIGTVLAGTCVVNQFVVESASPEAQLAGWRTSWFIFAAYALVVAICFILMFRDSKGDKKDKTMIATAESAPDGFVDIKD